MTIVLVGGLCPPNMHDDLPWADTVMHLNQKSTDNISAGSDADLDADFESDEIELEAYIRQTFTGDLAGIRERLENATGELPRTADFGVRVLNGNKGGRRSATVEPDAIQGFCRGGDAAVWIGARYGSGQTARFSIHELEEANAGILARSWCAKMQWNFNLSLLDASAAAAANAAGWPEPSEFSSMVRCHATHAKIQRRAAELRRL